MKLYDTDAADGREFATRHIVALANYIVNTWAGSPEAAEAMNALIPFLISRGEVAKAREYVERMPADSTERAGPNCGSGKLSGATICWA